MGLLALGPGAAVGDPQGQVGTAADPLVALYTDRFDGGITDEGSGPQSVGSLVGPDLTVAGGALSAAAARPDVTDGTTSVTGARAITVGAGLSVTDDGDGTATIDR